MPKLPTASMMREVVFLVDRSRYVWDMPTLRTAIQRLSEEFPGDLLIQHTSYKSSCCPMWTRSKAYDDKNLDFATKNVTQNFQSNKGEARTLSALQVAFAPRNDNDIPTEFIVVTTGHLWDAESVTKFVTDARKESQNTTRFFALAVGYTVGHRFIESIGAEGGGFAEIIRPCPSGAWHWRVVRVLKGALMPSSWSCEINLDDESEISNRTSYHYPMFPYHGLDGVSMKAPPYFQAPSCTSFMHFFSPARIFILLDRRELQDPNYVDIHVTTSTGHMVDVRLTIEETVARENTVHFLAAKALVEDLHHGRSWLRPASYTGFREGSELSFEDMVRS